MADPQSTSSMPSPRWAGAPPPAVPPAARWLVMCITPDFCETSGTSVPYFIVSEAQLADLQSMDVCFNGLRSLNFKSLMRSCTGNEAGEVGSKSGLPVVNQCDPLDKNDTVRINGQGALCEGDRFWMNHHNCIGRVFAIPAVSSPGDPNNLADVEFDRAVAELVSTSISQCGGDIGAARSVLTRLRQTAADGEVTENPVVVAAQHFLNSADSSYREARLLAFSDYWLKSLRVEKVADVVKKVPYLGELFFGQVNPDKPSAEYDERVARWSYAGIRVGLKRQRGIAWKPLETKKQEDADWDGPPPTPTPKVEPPPPGGKPLGL